MLPPLGGGRVCRLPRPHCAWCLKNNAFFLLSWETPADTQETEPSGDDVARILRVEDGPDEQVRTDLAPALLVVGRVREVDNELPGADRTRGEARARKMLEELAEELGIPDLDSDGPQFARTIGRIR